LRRPRPTLGCTADDDDDDDDKHLQTGSGVPPACYSVGTRGSSPGVKQIGNEADHSPPSNAEAKGMEL